MEKNGMWFDVKKKYIFVKIYYICILIKINENKNDATQTHGNGYDENTAMVRLSNR
jgi:hypothetical protein